jgi:hypothetical protein
MVNGTGKIFNKYTIYEGPKDRTLRNSKKRYKWHGIKNLVERSACHPISPRRRSAAASHNNEVA